jgi:hypothetical protein
VKATKISRPFVHTPGQPVVVTIHDSVDNSKQSPRVQPHVLVIVGSVVDLAAQEERVKLGLITNGGRSADNVFRQYMDTTKRSGYMMTGVWTCLLRGLGSLGSFALYCASGAKATTTMMRVGGL